MSKTAVSNHRTSRPRNTRTANDELRPPQDFLQYVKAYAREKPDVAALWCFGVGFVLGWKLKPW